MSEWERENVFEIWFSVFITLTLIGLGLICEASLHYKLEAVRAREKGAKFSSLSARQLYVPQQVCQIILIYKSRVLASCLRCKKSPPQGYIRVGEDAIHTIDKKRERKKKQFTFQHLLSGRNKYLVCSCVNERGVRCYFKCSFFSLTLATQGPEQVHVSRFYKEARNGKFLTCLDDGVQTLYQSFRHGWVCVYSRWTAVVIYFDELPLSRSLASNNGNCLGWRDSLNSSYQVIIEKKMFSMSTIWSMFICFLRKNSHHTHFCLWSRNIDFPVDELQRSSSQSEELRLGPDWAGIEAEEVCWNLLTKSSRVGLDWAGLLLLLAGSRAVVWWAAAACELWNFVKNSITFFFIF